jgi:DNA-directed RNA polymerase subunit RPC12/RpoP
MTEIDHEYTDEVVCPYCGFEYGDSYEFFTGCHENSEAQCEGCNKYFAMTRNVSVDYSTSKMCDKNKEEHEYKDFEYKGEKYQVCQKCGFINDLKKEVKEDGRID